METVEVFADFQNKTVSVTVTLASTKLEELVAAHIADILANFAHLVVAENEGKEVTAEDVKARMYESAFGDGGGPLA